MRKPTRGSGDRGRGRWERMIKEIIIHITGTGTGTGTYAAASPLMALKAEGGVN